MVDKIRLNKYLLYILTIMWICLIYSLSLQPAEESAETSSNFGKMIVSIIAPDYMDEYEELPLVTLDYIDHILRKIAHFTEFLILGVLVSCSACQLGLKRRFLYSFLFCMAAASLDESIQLFVPGRAGMVRDVLLDSTGALLGVTVVWLFQRGERKRKG